MIARLLALALLAASSASAQTPADFYRGKTIEITVGAGAGGGYDIYARLLARHLGRFLPGPPAVVVNNMPGGGGIAAANYLYNVAPKDGRALATFTNAMLTQPLFGAASVKFDPAGFGWLGSLSREDGVCVASRKSSVSAWNELRGKRLTVGTTAPGTTTYLFPLLLNRALGIDLRFVSGYADGGQVALAFERGEVDMICQTYSSLRISHPDWIAGGFAKPLVYVGAAMNSDLPDVPAIIDLAGDDDSRAILKMVLAPTAAGRPFAAPPGLPPGRLGVLREAFSAAAADPAFLADARKTGMDISPLDASGMDALLKDIFGAPPDVSAKVRALVAATERR